MEKEKTVDELLDELGWSWLPTALWIGFMALYFVVGWLDKW
jgi:hypothetical protein